MLKGVAHEMCDAPNLSMNPPNGTMKLSAVATQIQYFAVALTRGSDVSAQAAQQTSEANSR